MIGQLRRTLSERIRIVDLEYEIQRMEADLNFHREKTKVFEETLQEQQCVLAQLRKRQHSTRMEDDCNEEEL